MERVANMVALEAGAELGRGRVDSGAAIVILTIMAWSSRCGRRVDDLGRRLNLDYRLDGPLGAVF
jgi:hypothetical protein